MDREDRFSWAEGDVKVYDSLEELKRAIKGEGGKFIPPKPEPDPDKKRNRK